MYFKAWRHEIMEEIIFQTDWKMYNNTTKYAGFGHGLVVENSRVRPAADVFGVAGVCSKIADMAERDTALSCACAGSFRTFSKVEHATNVIKERFVKLLPGELLEAPLVGRAAGCPGACGLLIWLQLRFRPVSPEGGPAGLKVPSGEEGKPAPPSVGIFSENVVHKLCEGCSRLVHACQVLLAKIGLVEEALDS
jgi:hypothetical protein